MNRRARYKDLQLTQLRSFSLVASAGNFSGAAKELGLSTPTVWQQVRALEAALRVPLLRRRGRLVELTDEGRLLLELAQPHLSGMDSLARLFEARRAELPQRVLVTSTPYLLSYHLPAAVQEFAAAQPAVRLHLHVAIQQADVLRRVDRGEADLGVTYHDPEEPRHPRLAYEPLFDADFVLLLAPRHPLALKKRLTPADLVEYPMIVPPEGSYDRRTLERLLHRHGLGDRLQPVMETRSLDIISRYVALGVGVAVAHLRRDVELAVPGVRLRVVAPELPPMPVALVTRKDAHLPPVAEEFRRCVGRCLGAGAPG